MKRQLSNMLLLTSLFTFIVLTAFAQGQKTTAPAVAPTAPSVTPTSGFRAEFLRELSTIERNYVSVAEAVPAEKYTWRPGEGVRSISEVFMHVAGANFNLPRRGGAQPPADFKPQVFDTSTSDKAKVVETLKRSFAHLRQATLNVSDADSDKAIDWFNGKNTYRGAFLFMTRHLGEHLGQSIAYARMNGVVPPWTEEQQQRQRQQQHQQPPRQ